jgi:hypothetical protein
VEVNKNAIRIGILKVKRLQLDSIRSADKYLFEIAAIPINITIDCREKRHMIHEWGARDKE